MKVIIRRPQPTQLNQETAKMILEAELVKQMLEYCAIVPGAKITITVDHDNGSRATASLYDTAALVQSLYESLEYFQEDMM